MDVQDLQLQRALDAPLYLQLYRRVREAIASGKLRPGERVPSVRALASELHLARGTVELAYQMLTSEGYLLARGPAGTVVTPALPASRDSKAVQPSPSHAGNPAADRIPQAMGEPLPFQLGLPSLDMFPRKTWVRLLGRATRSLTAADMTYPAPTGHERLRRAVASYLGISRGIACSPEQVFITVGYAGALDLICRTLLQRGDTGWFEDPGYFIARQQLQHAGMRLAPVPVDMQGLRVDVGIQRAPDARFAVVTPTHQSPTGVALSLPRRLQLLEWAQKAKAWIVEDDYDSEFRYQGHPLPALKSLDGDDRVLYAGTFSKSLFPGLRLAYLVVPPTQLTRFAQAAQSLQGCASQPLQTAVADFMEQGHFARHLRRMRTLYAQRRVWLVEALENAFGTRLHIQPQAGGIHVLALFHGREDDRALAARAQARGLAVQALSDWRLRTSAQTGLLMGFTNIASRQMAEQLASALHASLKTPPNAA